jgi:signal transduction histidine kinase
VAGVQREESAQTASGTTLAWLRATMWLAAAVPTVLFGLVGWNLHQRALAEAQLRVDSAARVGEEHALKVFETNIALLNRVADLLGDDGEAALRAREQPLHEQLVRMTTDLHQLQGLFVIGPSGRIIVNNRVFPAPPVDVADRAFFRHHREGGAQPYFTEVLTSRTTGEPFFDMSLRRNGAGGSLTAVLSASMAPPYFAAFYSELAGQDRDLHIALRHASGALLAAWPPAPTSTDAATAAASSGLARAHDDGPRIAAERPLGAYPVHVAAWTRRSAVLAGWYRQLGLLAAFAFPTALVLIYVAWVALQRTRRSMQVAHQLQDETAHRLRVEDSLRQSQKLEALGRLGGGVAHDVNNLLMVIANNVHLHRRLQPTLADSKQLAAIERAIAGGTRLTRQLLSFSRRQVLRPERVRLQEQLPRMQELVAPAVGATIHVEVQVEPDTAPVEIDVAELELALINLAINARDAMPGGGSLRIDAANAADGAPPGLAGRFVAISVQDSGVGVAPELRERVFEPFFTTKDVGQGTGLGLAQVYGFCVGAGGTATLDSVVGVGTTVRLYFPAAAIGSATEP